MAVSAVAKILAAAVGCAAGMQIAADAALSRAALARADMERACAGWCATHGSDWSNKCGWPDCDTCSECSALAKPTRQEPMQDQGTAEKSSAGDNETEEGTTGGTAVCPKYCQRHENPWSVKCDWEDCMPCSPCPVDKVEPTNRPTSVPTPKPTREPTPEAVINRCPTWCQRHASEWAVKCDYEDCMPCEPCPVDKNLTASPTPQPTHEPTVEPTPEAEMNPCPTWCERSANPWTTKCGHEECSVCSPCPIDTEESTSLPTQAPTHQAAAPTTPRPTSPPAQPAEPTRTATDPPTAEEPSTAQECPRWCERNANPWTSKCAYQECSVCAPCPIDAEEEEEPSRPANPPPTAPQPAPSPATKPTVPQPTIAPSPPPSQKSTNQPPARAPPSGSSRDAPQQPPTAPSHPPTQLPTIDEETTAQECQPWCQRHTDAWSVKCSYSECSVCQLCPETSVDTTQEPAAVTTTAAPNLPTPTAEPDGTTEKVQNSDTPNTKIENGVNEKGTTGKGTAEKVQHGTTDKVHNSTDGKDGNATDGQPDHELVCESLCTTVHKQQDWDQKCLWMSCMGCAQCKEKMQPCMTSAECRQGQGQYCADPNEATVEVDTCARVKSILGVCICVDVLPGTNIVRVGN